MIDNLSILRDQIRTCDRNDGAARVQWKINNEVQVFASDIQFAKSKAPWFGESKLKTFLVKVDAVTKIIINGPYVSKQIADRF